MWAPRRNGLRVLTRAAAAPSRRDSTCSGTPRSNARELAPELDSEQQRPVLSGDIESTSDGPVRDEIECGFIVGVLVVSYAPGMTSS